MRRWAEVFIVLALVGFIMSMVAAAMKNSMLLGSSVKAYGQFTMCALAFSITRPSSPPSEPAALTSSASGSVRVGFNSLGKKWTRRELNP